MQVSIVITFSFDKFQVLVNVFKVSLVTPYFLPHVVIMYVMMCLHSNLHSFLYEYLMQIQDTTPTATLTYMPLSLGLVHANSRGGIHKCTWTY